MEHPVRGIQVSCAFHHDADVFHDLLPVLPVGVPSGEFLLFRFGHLSLPGERTVPVGGVGQMDTDHARCHGLRDRIVAREDLQTVGAVGRVLYELPGSLQLVGEVEYADVEQMLHRHNRMAFRTIQFNVCSSFTRHASADGWGAGQEIYEKGRKTYRGHDSITFGVPHG